MFSTIRSRCMCFVFRQLAAQEQNQLSRYARIQCEFANGIQQLELLRTGVAAEWAAVARCSLYTYYNYIAMSDVRLEGCLHLILVWVCFFFC